MGPLRPTPRPVTRINRLTLLLGGLLLLTVVAGLAYVKTKISMPRWSMSTDEMPTTVAKLPEVLTKPAPTYQAPVPPAPKELPPMAIPLVRTPAPTVKPWPDPVPAPAKPAPTQQAVTLPDFLQPRQEEQRREPERTETRRPEKPAPKPWHIVPIKGNLDGTEPKKPEGGKEATEQKGQAAALVKPAVWAIPQKPLQTIYASQLLYGVTETAIDSSIPGRVIIRLSADVQDKFGYQTVLIPHETLVIASQDQQPIQYGVTRISLKLEQLEFPNGTILSLKATLGDAQGATGMTGKTNHHYGKLAIAVGASAILNIGARAAAGQPGVGAFQPTIQQEAARDVGQQVQRDASSIIDRELRIRPTITIPAKTVCTIMLSENIQMNHRPLVVK